MIANCAGPPISAWCRLDRFRHLLSSQQGSSELRVQVGSRSRFRFEEFGFEFEIFWNLSTLCNHVRCQECRRSFRTSQIKMLEADLSSQSQQPPPVISAGSQNSITREVPGAGWAQIVAFAGRLGFRLRLRGLRCRLKLRTWLAWLWKPQVFNSAHLFHLANEGVSVALLTSRSTSRSQAPVSISNEHQREASGRA